MSKTRQDNLEPGRKADINRKRLFLHLRHFGEEDVGATLSGVKGKKALRRCGYQLSDFDNPESITLSSITVDQIPLKTETTGIFTIRQTEHQSKDTSANLFVIKNSEQSSLVINNGSFPREPGKSASIITTTEMALDFTTLTDVSNSKLVDVYTEDSQFGNHLGEFTTYTALRDISNGAICMTELSNNTVFAVMTDPSRNSLSGNAVKYLLGVALDDAPATKPVRILSNGYCTIRGDFLKQVPEDPNGVVQGQVSLDKETTGLTYLDRKSVV